MGMGGGWGREITHWVQGPEARLIGEGFSKGHIWAEGLGPSTTLLGSELEWGSSGEKGDRRQPLGTLTKRS